MGTHMIHILKICVPEYVFGLILDCDGILISPPYRFALVLTSPKRFLCYWNTEDGRGRETNYRLARWKRRIYSCLRGLRRGQDACWGCPVAVSIAIFDAIIKFDLISLVSDYSNT